MNCKIIITILKKIKSNMFQPAEHWKEDIEYIEAQYIVDNLQVTNDSAERGVKLSHDFLDSAKFV